MTQTLFGVPLAYWGIGCLAVASLYYFIWPKSNPARMHRRTRGGHLLLRYGHSLVWVLLAVGCIVAGAGSLVVGWLIAMTALALYIVFLVMLVRDRRVELADLAASRKDRQAVDPDATVAAGSDAGSPEEVENATRRG